MSTRAPLQVTGTSLLRYHIVCSILSKKPVDLVLTNACLQDFEVNFLKFIERLTAGSHMRLSVDRSTLHFTPGFVLGGVFSHEVPTSRCVTYLVDAAILLLPFAKHPSVITLTGATQGELDASVDTVRSVSVRWLQIFGVAASLRVVRRGAAPTGNGCIILTVENVRRLRSVTVEDRGAIKRVRGVAFASNCSGDLVQRAASTCKGELLNFLPDAYIVSDIGAGGHSVGSGYGLLLIAETITGKCVVSQETTGGLREPPEDVGVRCAKLFLDQVALGGCVDAHHQPLVLLLLGLSPDEASTIRFGPLTDVAVSMLVLIEQYFGVSCAIKADSSACIPQIQPPLLVSCIGSNAINVSKKGG